MGRRRRLLDIYRGNDPRDFPTYGVADAAAYLHVPRATIRAWVFGQRGGLGPVVKPAGGRLLSFRNLVELFVLAAIRRRHGLPMRHVRSAVRYLQQRFGQPHPLADQEMLTDGVSLFIDCLGRLVTVSEPGQLAMKAALLAVLQRIERDVSGPLRIYPFGRTSEPSPESPRVVFVDPRVQFGRPCLEGTSIPIAALRERWVAGDSIARLAHDYGVAEDAIERGLQFATATPSAA